MSGASRATTSASAPVVAYEERRRRFASERDACARRSGAIGRWRLLTFVAGAGLIAWSSSAGGAARMRAERGRCAGRGVPRAGAPPSPGARGAAACDGAGTAAGGRTARLARRWSALPLRRARPRRTTRSRATSTSTGRHRCGASSARRALRSGRAAARAVDAGCVAHGGRLLERASGLPDAQGGVPLGDRAEVRRDEALHVVGDVVRHAAGVLGDPPGPAVEGAPDAERHGHRVPGLDPAVAGAQQPEPRTRPGREHRVARERRAVPVEETDRLRLGHAGAKPAQ